MPSQKASTLVASPALATAGIITSMASATKSARSLPLGSACRASSVPTTRTASDLPSALAALSRRISLAVSTP
jgi:hypothetical protein